MKRSGAHKPIRTLAAVLSLLAAGLAMGAAPPRPYIGYVYPAGGQIGTTLQLKLGGQHLDDVAKAWVTGDGVTLRITAYQRALNPQEVQILRDQLRELRLEAKAETAAEMMMADQPHTAGEDLVDTPDSPGPDELLNRIEARLRESVGRPASASLANIVLLEAVISPEASPGRRELRLATSRGISNPVIFEVGTLPEKARAPMLISPLQVLGKPQTASRPARNASEQQVQVPCTLNGQIASGEIHRYRFTARRGEQLVFLAQARELIPFIADAVPGWFQPLLILSRGDGHELAYADDDQFRPDPVLKYLIPQDGEYVIAIHDALFRGREDFVYRLTLSEAPFLTSVFPLGTQVGTVPAVTLNGWNLGTAHLELPPKNSPAGLWNVRAKQGKNWSNPVKFSVDDLPDTTEVEPNQDAQSAQTIQRPVIINGRIVAPQDWDVFRFTGKSGETVVAEICARRLGSPLDSVLELTDAKGQLIAVSDDQEDPGTGTDTHAADSWVLATLPADGEYFVRVGDATGHGGEDYGYRLRVSARRPDFALFVTPSSLSLRARDSGSLGVQLVRKDGFAGPVQIVLEDPSRGFTAKPLTISGTQTMARLTIKTSLLSTTNLQGLSIVGVGRDGDREIRHQAIPAEDRMQAFLWRHLVPAQEMPVMVFNPGELIRSGEFRAKPAGHGTNANLAMPASTGGTNETRTQLRFTRQQVITRLRQLDALHREGLLTEEFHRKKIEECEGR